MNEVQLNAKSLHLVCDEHFHRKFSTQKKLWLDPQVEWLAAVGFVVKKFSKS